MIVRIVDPTFDDFKLECFFKSILRNSTRRAINPKVRSGSMRTKLTKPTNNFFEFYIHLYFCDFKGIIKLNFPVS